MKTIDYNDLSGIAQLADCCWGFEGDEVYSFHDIEDAIEYALDAYGGDGWPKELTVIAARPTVLTPDNIVSMNFLEDVIEHLDEEYGSPDRPSEITKAMKEAEKVFCAVIAQEYTSWICEEVAYVVLREPAIVDWIRRNCPNWLKGEPVTLPRVRATGGDGPDVITLGGALHERVKRDIDKIVLADISEDPHE